MFLAIQAKQVSAQASWSFRTAMPTARAGISAVLFEGEIYVIGGTDAEGKVIDTVERYDPISDTWSSGVPAKMSRSNGVARILGDHIMLMGGRNAGTSLKQVERYVRDDGSGASCEDDDSTGLREPAPCWEFVGSLQEEREGLSAVVLAGELYALSGSDKQGSLLTNVEKYDEITEQWSVYEPWEVNPGRFSFETVTVGDSAFSVGGLSGFGPLGLTQRYHAAFGTVDRLPLAPSRGSLATVAIGHNIYAMGGRRLNNAITARVDVFNATENQWVRIASMNTAREEFAAVAVGNDIYVFGGRDNSGNVLNSVEVISIGDPPATPMLVSPISGQEDVADSVLLNWEQETGVTAQLQVSLDDVFTSVIVDTTGGDMMTFELVDLAPSTTYYWRVRTQNEVGYSAWSEHFSFITAGALPAIPQLVSPADSASDVPLTVMLSWSSEQESEFDLQVALDQDFSMLIVSEVGLDTTAFEVSELTSMTQYFWRVRGSNGIGVSDWTVERRFNTANNVANDEVANEYGFSLNDNYPNPFSGSTTIVFNISAQEAGTIDLSVYNMLGRKIKTLVEGVYPPGAHQVVWDGVNRVGISVKSGLYIYRLVHGESVIQKKMMLIR